MSVIIFIKTPNNCKGYTQILLLLLLPCPVEKSSMRESLPAAPPSTLCPQPASPALSSPLPQNAPASQGWSSQILGACLPGAPSEPFSMLFLPPGTPSPSPHSTPNSFLSASSIPSSPGRPSSRHPGSWLFLHLLSSCPQSTRLQAA